MWDCSEIHTQLPLTKGLCIGYQGHCVTESSFALCVDSVIQLRTEILLRLNCHCLCVPWEDLRVCQPLTYLSWFAASMRHGCCRTDHTSAFRSAQEKSRSFFRHFHSLEWEWISLPWTKCSNVTSSDVSLGCVVVSRAEHSISVIGETVQSPQVSGKVNSTEELTTEMSWKTSCWNVNWNEKL